MKFKLVLQHDYVLDCDSPSIRSESELLDKIFLSKMLITHIDGDEKVCVMTDKVLYVRFYD